MKDGFIDVTYEDLTSEQILALKKVVNNPNDNFFIEGCAGSGKTLIATFAGEILNKQHNKKCQFLVYTKLLKKFVDDNLNKTNMQKGKVDNYHSWIRSVNTASDIAIIDECQDFSQEFIDKIKAKSASQIWLGDASQQLYEKRVEDNGLEKLKNDVNNKLVLSTNFRNSISVANFAKYFINLNKFDNCTLEEKIKRFIEPIQKNTRQTSGARNQPVTLIEANDVNEEYNAIAKIINEIQTNEKGSKQIIISQFLNKKVTFITEQLAQRGISFYKVNEDKTFTGYNTKDNTPNFCDPNLIIISPMKSLKGLEADFIILPQVEEYNLSFFESENINDNILFVLFTRAKQRLYCTFSDKTESYIHKKIKNLENNDFSISIKASDIVKSGNIKLSEEELEKKIKKYFKEFGNMNEYEF